MIQDYEGGKGNGVTEGKIRSIRISNFNREQTEKILAYGRIISTINQLECQYYELRKFFEKKNISMEV